jgi:hypothetical protein
MAIYPGETALLKMYYSFRIGSFFPHFRRIRDKERLKQLLKIIRKINSEAAFGPVEDPTQNADLKEVNIHATRATFTFVYP